LLIYHVLNHTANTLRAFDELAAKALVGLPFVGLAENVGAGGVGDGAHDAIANSNQHQTVEDQVVHYSCIRYLSLTEPFELRANVVQSRKYCTVQCQAKEYDKPIKVCHKIYLTNTKCDQIM